MTNVNRNVYNNHYNVNVQVIGKLVFFMFSLHHGITSHTAPRNQSH